MSVISLNCPGCQQPIEAPAEMAGQPAQCPTCSQEMMIPQSAPDVGSAPVVQAAGPQAGSVCTSCGADMASGAVLCVQCGFHSGLGKKLDTAL